MTSNASWDPQRFWSKVDKTGECWVWTGSRDRKGYGRIKVARLLNDPTPKLAHRISWLLAFGAMPPPHILLLHRCDNPPCVRPDHLFLGSPADNSADMIQKGRQRFHDVPWSRRTHGTTNGMARMTEQKVIELRRRAAAGESFRALAPEYDIAESTANAIILGGTWRHVWPYDENHQPDRVIHPRPTRRRERATSADT